MSLEIQQRGKEGVTLLDVKGRLAAGEPATLLRDTFSALAASGIRKMILNLRDVVYIDSTGLGALVVCFTTMRKGGGSLKLLNLSRRSIELLVLTKLATVFEIFNEEQDAVNSFFPDRAIQRFDVLSFVQEKKKD